jgi:hypothetical protein
LWKEIFIYLESSADFFSASVVCKAWHSAIYNVKFLRHLVQAKFGIDVGDSQEFRSYINAFKASVKFSSFDGIPWQCVLCKSAPRSTTREFYRLSSTATLLEKFVFYSQKIPSFRSGIPFRDEMMIFWCGCKYDTSNSYGNIVDSLGDEYYNYGSVCRWGIVHPRVLPIILATYGNKKSRRICLVCQAKMIDLREMFGKAMCLCNNGHLYGDDTGLY